MFKVLIIDDEAIIARGLQAKMDWKRLGCTVCGVAADGLEGQRLVEELAPDIVISDIVMPGLTGLELSKYLFNRYPSIVTIILTAHDEFKYAQQAIRFGVKEYILKPIDKTEIIRAVGSAVKMLRSRQSMESDVNKLHDIVTEVKPILTSTLLFNIALNGESEMEAVEQKLRNFQMVVGKMAAMVFELEPVPGEEGSSLHRFALKSAAQSIFERFGCTCQLKETEGLLVALALFDGSLMTSVIRSRLVEIGSEIRGYILHTAGLRVSGGMGRVVGHIRELHTSYLEARRALEQRFFANGADIFSLPEGGVEPVRKTREYPGLGDFVRAVEAGSCGNALEAMEKLFAALSSTGDRRLALEVAHDMVRQLSSLLHTAGAREEPLLALDQPEALYSLRELRVFMGKAVEEACTRMVGQSGGGGSTSGSGKIVHRVEQMIRDCYGDKGFSLQAAADRLEVSLSHLSRLFKKETNQNFMEYLTEVRIQEAKKLLAGTGLKNNEIADRIGFYGVGYFSQVFRKKCRMTPSEYRQQAAAQKIQ